jgi:hypothetical protein
MPSIDALAVAAIENKSFPLKKVLMCAASEIAVFGWDSDMTPERVWHHLAGDSVTRKKLLEELLNAAKRRGIDLYASEFGHAVDSAIEWAKTLGLGTSPSSWENSAHALAQRGVCYKLDLNLACSILVSYGRFKKSEKGKSNFIGTVNAPINVTIKVVNVQLIAPKGFGGSIRALVKGIECGSDNIVFWWCDRDKAPVVDDTLQVSARVKEHRTFKGVKETFLSYVKYVKV